MSPDSELTVIAKKIEKNSWQSLLIGRTAAIMIGGLIIYVVGMLRVQSAMTPISTNVNLLYEEEARFTRKLENEEFAMTYASADKKITLYSMIQNDKNALSDTQSQITNAQHALDSIRHESIHSWLAYFPK